MPPHDHDIDDSIRRVQSGDVEAYTRVVLQYQRRLRAIVAASCPPGVDADEIAHEAFVEAYKKIDAYEPGTDIFAWLSTFARNLVLRECTRAKRAAHNRLGYLRHVIATAAAERLGSATTLAEDRVNALRACLDRLDSHLRSIVKKRYTHDNPISRIAEELGRTENAVKVQLCGIRKKLRQCVNARLAFGKTGHE